MIYPHDPDNLMLWPRLIHAAQQDTVISEALRELMAAGARLALNLQSGGLALSAGAMPQSDYNVIRDDKLAPRRERMATYLTNARSSSHPWAQAIMQAYIDLNDRCTNGHKALEAARADRDRRHLISRHLLDRYQLAHLMASALYQAGYPAYWDHANRHFLNFATLEEGVRRDGLDYEVVGKAWPVETPDGWLWMIDDPRAECKADLGRDKGGVRVRQETEPVLTYVELGEVIQQIEVARRDWTRKEAG